MWAGKVLGALFGMMSGGPVGLLIGAFIGHFFDRAVTRVTLGHQPGLGQIQATFFQTTFKVMGHLAKADGVVSESEIEQARHVMAQMRLNDTQKQEAIKLFSAGKVAGFDIAPELQKLRASANSSSLILMFMEIQISVAIADGEISDPERNVLITICQALGVSTSELNTLIQRLNASSRQSSQPSEHSLKDAYEVLGVAKGDTDAVVKRAYRKLISEHHPDKLVAQGLPEEMMVLATEKSQQIQAAYDDIKQSRKANA
jgi:DnaJ like chaperone protein